MTKSSPRIHVLLASKAPVGVVIRRGPAKHVAMLLWDRSRDKFQMGQWLKGRIFERRSDLSPDGKYLIYFAMNGKWHLKDREMWTAISYAPYLKAIALFPKDDRYHGGGLFTGKDTYWINDGDGHHNAYGTMNVRRDPDYSPPDDFGPECLGVYYPRLLRDGWELVDRLIFKKWVSKDTFEKSVGKGWKLRKIVHVGGEKPRGKGLYWEEHELVSSYGRDTIQCPTWEWAELDGKRLVWAEGGKLFAAQIQKDGLSKEVELHDFNDMAFEEIKAPY